MPHEYVVPFTIIYDHREKAPYTFLKIRGDVPEKKRLLKIETEKGHLKTGDYSIKGYEDIIVVERKSLIDLYGSVGKNRERFRKEQERLSAMEYSAIVVEAPLHTIATNPPKYSNMSAKSVFRTVLFWSTVFKVQWFPCKCRRMAEVVTFRLLNYWYKRLEEMNEKEVDRESEGRGRRPMG
jgi:ERCC4-type nuclease